MSVAVANDRSEDASLFDFKTLTKYEVLCGRLLGLKVQFGFGALISDHKEVDGSYCRRSRQGGELDG